MLVNALPLTTNGAMKYICKTQHCQTATTNRLAFQVTSASNFNDINRYIHRWTPGCTLLYHVTGLGLSPASRSFIKTEMLLAVAYWQSTGLSISFRETPHEEEATFLVSYNYFLEPNIFAKAFFPAHELGHVLGLRHENWDTKKVHETDDVHHYPDSRRDGDSIMNDELAADLRRMCLSNGDRQYIRDFYNLPPGRHEGFVIVDVPPTPFRVPSPQAWPLGPPGGLLARTTWQTDEAVPATEAENTEVLVRVWYVDFFLRFGHWALYIWRR